MTNETLLMWAAVTVYAAGSVSLAFGTAFRTESLLRWGLWIALAGLVPHTLAIGIRWARTGHGPYLGFYEVVSSFAWAAVFVLGAISARNAKLRNLGVIIVPIAFVLLAAAMFTPSADLEVTGKLASWWLTIHVAFAKLTYASFTASFALALAYLVRDSKRHGALREVLDKLPRQEVLDDLSFRFISVGFIFLFVMIAAGAVWANEAWGRYWGWDPIETWSAISWIVYAVYLHLRLTMGWKGRKASIYAVAALPVVLFALIGVPVVYQSIHGAYLMGY